MRVDAGEQAIEDRAGIGELGQWCGGARPGDVARVRTAVARVATACAAATIDAQLQRPQRGCIAECIGELLIERDAVLDVGALGLARVRAGQERASTRGV